MSQHLGSTEPTRRGRLGNAGLPYVMQPALGTFKLAQRCLGHDLDVLAFKQLAHQPQGGRKNSKDHLQLRQDPRQSKDVSSTGQQSQSAAGTPKQAVPVEPRGALQEASGNAVAAKQQDAERMQAAEEASTSGREYWQVMRPSLALPYL